jgi:hypothetical protein
MPETLELESLGKAIPEDYDYMDTMPLEGWMWEFIRRNNDYRRLYQECRRTDTTYRAYLDKIGQITRTVALKPNFSSRKLDRRLFFVRHFIGIPNPNASFDKFGDVKPDIDGFTPVLAFKPREDDLTNDSFSERHSSYILGTVLPPSANIDTLFIGIDTNADINFVQDKLKQILGRYLRRREGRGRVRDDKWKHYLIAYDLRKEKNLTYDSIGVVLMQAYPEVIRKRLVDGRRVPQRESSESSFTKSNCEYYYTEALKLIDNGYKKHLPS